MSYSNHADADPVDEVARLRDRLMEDLAPIPVFAKAIGKGKRAVQRMVQQGQIKVVKFGATPYVVLSSARKVA